MALFDFWTTKCTRCPAALQHLNTNARSLAAGHGVKCVAVNLDDCAAARDIVAGLNNVVHVAVAETEREHLKRLLNMKSVPHYVLLSKGSIVAQGKSVDFVDFDSFGNTTPMPECVGGVCTISSRKQKADFFDDGF
ncbi:hypothetical protein JKP88DRAFT_219982 [Tribonema minus]|uniref:Thioredoxin-like fold domain-containing protein n=1 Tax=Tribonema minus TaxID=303371 RepID=A0A835YY80_9STRA|nr:hypothetical protein JKP88DRAFT_219982 [Tribonema minus]